MGFDLYGVDARTKNGEYFRNNVWWWRPLWTFCYHHKLITSRQFERGMFNDGYRIPRRQAEKIAIKLLHMLEQGEVKEYVKVYASTIEKLSSGDWGKHYPFNEENVQEFARFCMESGGFEIC